MKASLPTLALLAPDFPPSVGGIQTLTVEIYSRLADLTQLVVAPAVPAGCSGDEAHGLPLVRTHQEAGGGVSMLRYLYAATRLLQCERTPPALLHCNHLFAGYAGRWLQRRRGWRYAVWIHGEELGKVRNRRLAASTLARASLILTNSEFTAALARQALGRRRAPPRLPPIVIVPLGAPSRWISSPLPPPASRPAPVILTVARLLARDRYKGVDTALSAMAELRRRGRAFEYWVAGDGDDRTWLEAQARAAGLDEQVKFLGPVPDSQMMALYDQCDIFLLCSREEATVRGLGFEGFGIVLIEAGARGKPVVAGHSGGVPDAVADGVSGLLVAPLSPAAVADGLEQLLIDPALRQHLGAQGRARVRQRYNWDTAAAVVRQAHLQACAESETR